MLKSSINSLNLVRFFSLSLALLWVSVSGCTQASDNERAELIDPAPVKSFAEGSGSEVKGHPVVKQAEKLQREVIIPESVEGKWKAVKILIKNKTEQEKSELKLVPIGSSFQIGDTGIKVTAGPFFPNFVMDQGTYTSMNNQAINPAVQLVVEENGKVLYKGWTFAKYPEMYAFEHDVFALELKDYISEDVS